MSERHDERPSAEIAASIRSSITTLRKAWPWLENPPKPQGSSRRAAPGSKPPVPIDALSLRAEILADLAFWCHALLEDHPEGRRADVGPLDLTDPGAMLDQLYAEAIWAGGWEFGKRLDYELRDHAFDARCIAWPRAAEGILLGRCPVTIGVEGDAVACEGKVRAKATESGEIACPRCRTKDTIEGWILRLVGTDRPVTIPQLVPIIRGRLGVRIDERTLQRWAKEGHITAVGGTPGKPQFDRRHVLTVVVAREERHARSRALA